MKNIDSLVVATNEECQLRRKILIYAGVIKTNIEVQERVRDVFEPAPRTDKRIIVKEEGTYRCKPIKTDIEYEKRKSNYFHMLQSILWARADLKLEFEKQ